jgi:hypothetical protein
LQVTALVGGTVFVIGAFGDAAQRFLDGPARGRLAEYFTRPFDELFVDLDRGVPVHENILTP